MHQQIITVAIINIFIAFYRSDEFKTNHLHLCACFMNFHLYNIASRHLPFVTKWL